MSRRLIPTHVRVTNASILEGNNDKQAEGKILTVVTNT